VYTEVTFQMQLVCNMVLSLPSGMHPQSRVDRLALTHNYIWTMHL
jgi:hypothetical protein